MMGDGRYYTPEQFFAIISITGLIIVLVIALMLNFYKVEKYKKSIRFLGILLAVSLTSKYIVEIAYFDSTILLFDYLDKLSILLYLIINMQMLVRNKEDRSFMVLVYVLLLIIPITGIKLIQIEHKLLYGIYLFHYLLISNRLTKYKVSASVFSDVKKHMLDYVYIISTSGQVIFKNDKIINAPTFKDAMFIDIDNISDIFINETTIRNDFSKQFIEVASENTLYFHYHKKALLNKKEIVGYIMTFVDITHLISMLDELSENRERSKKTNLELDRYKDIVYEIEKEKEINILLDEIANNQQKSMYILKNNIEKLNINEQCFLEDLDTISEKAKLDLSDVRKAVTSYINYYD